MCVCVECMYRCECRGRAPPGAHPQQNSRWLQRASLCCHLNVVWQTIKPVPCFCYSMHVAIDSTHVMQMSCKCHANVMFLFLCPYHVAISLSMSVFLYARHVRISLYFRQNTCAWRTAGSRIHTCCSALQCAVVSKQRTSLETKQLDVSVVLD